ncbi:EAL domain-containing protein [Devosia sp. Root635]|uniref:EAL domain-containing protein n=1 Tax=Devosia sp. Root635 TaxID=1736575 RepID=UPI0009E887C1|nr:EAL domain-containing protein [Devosia sp. Root635]
MSVIDFFLRGHDLGLVVLAAVVCLVSSYACVGLLRHAHRAQGRVRLTWTVVAALAVGFGIWATHFVAVLAFRPGFTLSYDVGLTTTSLLIAILVCGAGIAMAIRGSSAADHFLGGAVVGVAISSMHYAGIAALVMGGDLGWNPAMITTSILAGIVLGGLAFVSAMGTGTRRLLGGAGLLTLAICAMHFTAMGAADFSRCFPLVANGSIHNGWLAVALAFISVLILGAALGSVLLDEADRRRTARERERQLRDAERINEATSRLELAMTHMAQGLSLYDGEGHLRLYNARLPQLLGIDPERDLAGLSFRDICQLTIVGRGEAPDNLDELTERVLEQHMPLIRGKGGEIVHTFSDERTLRINHSPVGDGSWVSTVDDITERQRSAAAIAHLARHDGLTGLPNRAMFNEHFDAALANAEESDNNLAVIAIDLDRFKEVNDSYGHAAGDVVLKTLAARLSEGLKDGELVARLGGDEFAALKSFTSMDAVREFLARLEAALFTRLVIDGSAINTGGSIGVAIYPEDGADRSKLLNNADLAMYRAKAEFDRRVAYYESEMDEHARQRRDMARDIWAALEQNAFYLAYQVQKSVATGDITGYEVLLRWERPGHGNVSPADFIPVAEECGAIGAIGNWVLKMACLEAASWPEPYKIAVNISGLQLAQVELIDTVRSVLILSGLSPERLELEVTETSIIADKQRALHILRQIKAMGVSIAIDDFGTGYSSLDTLRSFPFDKIKLDRSFMDEVEDNEQSKAIVRAILALGRSLHVPVLAEGVETRAQLEVLKLEGCNEAQGFLLGRPGAIDWDDALEAGLLA